MPFALFDCKREKEWLPGKPTLFSSLMIGSWANTFIFSWYVMVPLLLCSIASLAIIL